MEASKVEADSWNRLNWPLGLQEWKACTQHLYWQLLISQLEPGTEWVKIFAICIAWAIIIHYRFDQKVQIEMELEMETEMEICRRGRTVFYQLTCETNEHFSDFTQFCGTISQWF